MPKKTIDNKNFITAISKIILNSTIENPDKNRNDFISKSLILLIDNIDFNKNLRWIEYSEFKKYLKTIINKNLDVTDNEIDKWIYFLYDIEDNNNKKEKDGVVNDDQKDDIQIEEENNYYENLINEIYEPNNSINNENIKNDSEFEYINLKNYIDDTDLNTNEFNNFINLLENVNLNKEEKEFSNILNDNLNYNEENNNESSEDNSSELNLSYFKKSLKERLEVRLNKNKKINHENNNKARKRKSDSISKEKDRKKSLSKDKYKKKDIPKNNYITIIIILIKYLFIINYYIY